MRKIVIGNACKRAIEELLRANSIPRAEFLGWTAQLETDIEYRDIEPMVIREGRSSYLQYSVNHTYSASTYHAVWDLDKVESRFDLIEFHLIKLMYTAS